MISGRACGGRAAGAANIVLVRDLVSNEGTHLRLGRREVHDDQ